MPTNNHITRPSHPTPVTPFSDLLNYLFVTHTIAGPDGRRRTPTLRDVSNATGISIAYLSEARNGSKQNPPKEFIERLAAYFQVEPAFFFGPLPDGLNLTKTYQAASTDPTLAKIMLRATGFGHNERQLLLDWMDSVERARTLAQPDATRH